jgi:hypothetical protein
MPWGPPPSKLYPIFTLFGPNRSAGIPLSGEIGSKDMIVGIAAMMFIALFGWGQDYFHWTDPNGKVQLALFTSFILGIICGFKTKQ